MIDPGLLWVPVVEGVKDAVNPCVLMVVVFFGLLMKWVEHNAREAGWCLFVFAFLVFMLLSIFNLGYFQAILYTPLVQVGIEAFNIFLGFTFLGLGLIFVLGWWRLLKKQPSLACRILQLSFTKNFIVFVAVVGALAAAVAMSVWPMSPMMSVLANYVIVPGKFFSVAVMVILYTACFLLPLWFLAGLKPLWVNNDRLACSLLGALALSSGFSAVFIFLQ